MTFLTVVIRTSFTLRRERSECDSVKASAGERTRMAWRTMAVRDQRVEFVVRAQQAQERLSRLCAEFGISRPTGYVWLKRYREQGVSGIEEQSRRPRHSPRQTAPPIEQRIAQLRRERPDWGARKLQQLLRGEGIVLPVITVHRVLLRHGLVRPDDRRSPAWRRFERAAPNQLWQMDFKSPKGCQQPVGPLSVIDDHSRYVVALEKTGSTRTEAVQERLERAFVTYGLPEAMLMGSRGQLKLDGQRWEISKALARERVQLVRIHERILVYYCNSLLKEIDVRAQRLSTIKRWTQPNCKVSLDN